MQRKVRELDFDAIVSKIEAETNRARRITGDRLLQADLAFVRSTADAVELLRNKAVLSALREAKTLDDVRADDPLIQAFVRAQHHPAAKPMPPSIPVQEGLSGPDAAPSLQALVDAHLEWTWDPAVVQALLVRAVRERAGEREVDDAAMPWAMHWGPALGAFRTLMTLVTLRAFGDL